MSGSSIPPQRPPRTNVPPPVPARTEQQTQLLAELTSVLQASAGQFERTGSEQVEPNLERADSPPHTGASQQETKRHSMKMRFLRAIFRRDFSGAYQEISQKVSMDRFRSWLADTLPTIDPTILRDVSFRSFVGEVYGGERAVNSDEESPFSLPEDRKEAGIRILAEVSDLYDRGTLYRAKGSIVPKIDAELKALKKVKGADAYKALLKELKAELMKDNLSQADVNGVVLKDEYSEVIAEIFPAFSPTMTSEKFREQFPAIAEGICSIIDEHHLHEEGLFRLPGNVATQGVIVSRILEGTSSEQLRGFCKDETQYCSTLKSLISQLKAMEERGEISQQDLEQMRPGFQRINETFQKLIAHRNESGENVNKMEKHTMYLAAPEICSFLDRMLATTYKVDADEAAKKRAEEAANKRVS